MRHFILVCLTVCSALAFTDEDGNVGPASSPAQGPSVSSDFPALNWTTKTPMLLARRSMAAAFAQGLFYCIGGYTTGRVNTNEVYFPTGDSWTTRTPMPSVRNACAGATVSGKVYVVGGYDGSSRLTTVEEYDPAGDSWHVCPPMTWQRTVPAVVGFGGRLYCLGGFDGVNYPTTVERYDPVAGTWDTVAPIPTGRAGLAAAALGGKIYAIGGWDGTTTHSTVEIYDPAANTWTTAASIAVSRMYHSACALGGYVLCVGGQLTFSGPQTDVVEAYDTTSSSWSVSTPMLVARGSLGVASGGDEAYAAGGWTGAAALDQNDIAELASGIKGPARPAAPRLSVAPSPARTMVRIAGPPAPVRIFSSSGALVAALPAPGFADLSSFAPGVYLASCAGAARRFVVSR